MNTLELRVMSAESDFERCEIFQEVIDKFHALCAEADMQPLPDPPRWMMLQYNGDVLPMILRAMKKAKRGIWSDEAYADLNAALDALDESRRTQSLIDNDPLVLAPPCGNIRHPRVYGGGL